MMQLEFGGHRYPISEGEFVVGSDPGAHVRLTGPAVQARHALLEASPEGAAVIRKAAVDGEVLVNGIRLGAEPSPLLHGDKIEIGEHELLVVDERRGGSTQFMSAAALANLRGGAASAPAARPATASTGGRLVCLTDGREYTVAESGLTFGRDAGSDVVVDGKDVSRRHAEIQPTPEGYLLVDASTNGTFVSGDRVQGQRLLARADVIRIGPDEFRFYADAAPAQPASPPRPAALAPELTTPPQGAAQRLNDTMHGMRFPRPPSTQSPFSTPRSSGPLASLLARSGKLKGQRFPIRVPVVNIGRAEYNDVVVPDESVSTAHAKLQWREGVWILSDSGSTNGTFVEGERITNDSPLSPGVTVRLGEVSFLFDPTDDELGISKGSGTKVMEALEVPSAEPAPSVKAKVAQPAAVPRGAPAKPRVVVSPPRDRGLPMWLVAAVVIAALVAVAIVFLR